MAETLRSDGKAVDVTVLGTVTKGDVVSADGFAGIALQDAVSGEEIAIEIATREHELTVGSSVTAAKGDILYVVTDTGVLSNTDDGTTKPFAKVTVAKDANNVCWAVLLPQS